ncbi:molybdopterin-dependent oxidoreductase [Arthrobacter cupressi]|uniref:DMSO/TMAO reductase YedYZ, molybdopterin-dependent catalytic subunit n=1 Tax=Arthrobacter cupressi TaxID=1045773 RepID=A0A1G8RYB7_9MICC|nr:molybdopterin-dependent oxidoreductase [Arthrobacter cupressi]NYD79358.1 DMSO/TMAO reductase YedYZ molybdopterin-dependent catalytic subunit [Arthrobacter cupressi]SDJ21937.1 DMSO/TMAO reductase YedYZ, molybdopterin-dependent catalytic subunit [Arthrobacter cupressi]
MIPAPRLSERAAAARTRWSAAAGVVAVGSGVALGELLAALLSPGVSPVTALGGAVIDVVPPAVKDLAVAWFGTADKAVLIASIGLVTLVLAAVAGILEDRRPGAGLVLAGLAGAAGLAAVVTRAQAAQLAALAPVGAAMLAIGLLRVLSRRLALWNPVDAARPSGTPGDSKTPRDSRTPGEAAPLARRGFLQALGLGAAGAAVAGAVTAVVRRAGSLADTARSALALPAPKTTAQAIPAGAALDVAGISPLVTPNPDFYRIDTALIVPTLSPEDWTLKVTGLVEREVELNFAELLAKPMTARHVTIACVSNEVGGDLIGNALWLGWPVRELLAMAGPRDGADMVLSVSSDGWTAGTPLEALTDGRDALLAVGMNGEPLPLEHGFPVRMIVPGLYGYVSATKWLTELKVTRFADDAGYWTPRGWSALGPIKTQSRIDVPRPGATVTPGRVQFGGVAWAQHRGIAKVELRVDRGPWQQADLAPGISKDTWVQWRSGLDLGPGQHEIQVRATDSGGTPQPEQRTPPAPDGATGYHTVTVTAG